MQLLYHIIHYYLERTCYKITISKKIKAIENKIEEAAKILALSSGNVSKYNFLIGIDFLAEKYVLEWAAIIKRFEYFPFGSELKKQTDIAKDQHKFCKDQMTIEKKMRVVKIRVTKIK